MATLIADPIIGLQDGDACPKLTQAPRNSYMPESVEGGAVVSDRTLPLATSIEAGFVAPYARISLRYRAPEEEGEVAR